MRACDPEAAQQLLDPAIHLMMDAVHRFEGTVNQVLGDGIMALFGAPIAHEDHALRACYAALALQTAIRSYADEVRRAQGMVLQLRVGLNSGEVVVRAIGTDLHMDYSAVGQHTHLAARMEQLATPGTILLTAATWRLVEGLVRVQALGAVPIKGLTKPVEAFELVGVTPLQRRLQAAAARGLTRFVGRQHELAALYQALAQAAAGHGQVVALVGEAGVGKSRLAYEFVHAHSTQGWRVLESASGSHGKATPYFPVLDLLKRYCHLEEQDNPRTVRAKVTGQILTLDEALQDTLPALLALLEVLPDDSPFCTLDPPQRRQRTLQVLKRVLLRESQMQPLLLVFEDLHWIDAETQALLDGLVESVPTARLLLLVNYRPEYQHGWGSKTYYTQLRLDPLPPASAEEFLAALLGDDPGLAPLKQLLITRTESNPFFLEESVRTLVETGVLVGEPGAYRLAQALPTIQVPATVQAVLAARIDRLPPEEKRLLQTAAVIGTEVPLPLLQAIAEVPETALQARPRTPPGGRVPLRDEPLPRAGLHLQARPDPAGGLRNTAPGAAAGAPRPHRRGPGGARRGPAGRAGRTAGPPCPTGRGVGQGPGILPAGRREGPGAVGPPRGCGYFEQALSALSICRRRATCTSRLSTSDSPCASSPSVSRTSGASWHVCARLRPLRWPSTTRAGSARSAVYLAAISASWGRMTRLSPPPSVPWRSPWLVGRSTCTRWRTSASAKPTRPRATIGRRSTASGRRGVLRWGAAPRALRSLSFLLCSPVPTSPGAMPSWACSSRAGPSGRKASGSPRRSMHPASLHLPSWDRFAVPPPRRPTQSTPPARTSLGVYQDADLPAWFPWMAAPLGTAYTLGVRVTDAVPLLTQALDQTMATEMIVTAGALSSLPGGGADAGGPPGGGATPWLSVRWPARAYKERGNQAYALRLLGEIAARWEPPESCRPKPTTCRPSPWPRSWACARSLAHCHHGLGRCMPDRPGEQARAALAAAIDLYRVMNMTFWLPQAEAALAQVEGR